MEAKPITTIEEDFIKKAQIDLNENEIVDFFQTEIHGGRHVSAALLEDGGLFIKQSSFHVIGHEPSRLRLTPETFSFLLETLLHAEKQFGIDRKKHLSAITDGTGKIKYKKTISYPVC